MNHIVEATVKIISFFDLHIGMDILWSNQKRQVLAIDRQEREVTLSVSYDPELTEKFKSYSYYYLIQSCIEQPNKVACPGCGDTIEEILDGGINFCTPKCKDRYEEEIKEDYGIYGM